MNKRQIARFQPGQELLTTNLNPLVDAINANANEGNGRIADLGYTAWFTLALEIKTLHFPSIVEGDLTCIFPGDSGNPQAVEWNVFLPNIYTELSRPFPEGNTTYVYTDINTRTASRAGEADEVQHLTPPLLQGEVIAVYNEIGVLWRMLGDGRMWAIDPPASP